MITITSDELQSTLLLALDGTTVSVDTTRTAPPVYASEWITNPAWTQCEEGEAAACDKLLGAARVACIHLYATRCAAYPEQIYESEPFYTYVEFGPLAAEYGATDIVYPLQTIQHNGTFSFSVDINYVHALFGRNLTAGFLPGVAPSTQPEMWLNLTDIVSNSPTVILGGDYPDVNLTNMVASVALDGVAPTADGQSVDYSTVYANFTFDWDVNDVPDWLVSDFVDVQGTIQTLVSDRLIDTFSQSSTHAALSRAMKALLDEYITQVHPAGYSTITGVIGSGTSWLVYYKPN